MSKEQDQIFFRNFSLVVGGIAVIMVIFFIMAHIVTSDDDAGSAQQAEQVAAITEPVGQVAVAGEETAASEEMVADTAEAASGPADGESIYNGLCVNCHGVAALASMIPQAGDAAAWGPRIEKGIDTLYEHALNGFTGDLGMMPAKGGNPALSDDEVKAAVDFIVGKVQ